MRREDEHGGQPIQGGERALGNKAEEPDEGPQAERLDASPQLGRLPDFVADDHQMHVLMARLGAESGEGLDQSREILVRFDVAGVEDEALGDLVALFHPIEFLLVGRFQKVGVNGV